MTVYNNHVHANYLLSLKQVSENSWWIMRTDMPQHGTLSSTPRVVFFGNTEAQARKWLEERNEPFFLQQ